MHWFMCFVRVRMAWGWLLIGYGHLNTIVITGTGERRQEY